MEGEIVEPQDDVIMQETFIIEEDDVDLDPELALLIDNNADHKTVKRMSAQYDKEFNDIVESLQTGSPSGQQATSSRRSTVDEAANFTLSDNVQPQFAVVRDVSEYRSRGSTYNNTNNNNNNNIGGVQPQQAVFRNTNDVRSRAPSVNNGAGGVQAQQAVFRNTNDSRSRAPSVNNGVGGVQAQQAVFRNTNDSRSRAPSMNYGGGGSIDAQPQQAVMRNTNDFRSRSPSSAQQPHTNETRIRSPSISSSNKEKLDDLLSDLLNDNGIELPTQSQYNLSSYDWVSEEQRPKPQVQAEPVNKYSIQNQNRETVNFGAPQQAVQVQRPPSGVVSVSGTSSGYSVNQAGPRPGSIYLGQEPEWEQIEIEPVIQETEICTYLLPQNEYEMEFAREIIQIRRNPAYYAYILEKDYRPYFQGNVLRRPNTRPMATREGLASIDNAIAFLKTTEPNRNRISQNFGMCLAAKEAFDEHAPSGSMAFPNSCGKLRSFSTELSDEVTELCGWGGDTARELLIFSFVICDGDPMKRNREILFDTRWLRMGVCAGPHASVYRRMGIVNFTIEFEPDLSKMRDREKFKLIESKTKPEALKLADALAILNEVDPNQENAEEDRARQEQKRRLTEIAIRVAVATERLVSPTAASQ